MHLKGLHGLRSLVNQPLEQAVGNGLDFTKSLLFYTAGALVLLAAIDAPYQKWNWMRKLKMTREEIKREMKESEGSPEVKGRIRQMQMQMSQRQMMEAVPKADVVLMNPTHYAVALKYEGGKMRARSWWPRAWTKWPSASAKSANNTGCRSSPPRLWHAPCIEKLKLARKFP